MLDLVTALVLWSAATATVAVVLFVVWLRNPGFHASLWWSGAFAALAAGRLLNASRGQLPDVLTIEAGVALSLIAFTSSLMGFAALDGRRWQWWFPLPLAIWLVGTSAPQFAEPGVYRIGLFHTATAVGYGLQALLLGTAGRRSPARRWLICIFCFASALNGLSGVIVALSSPPDFFSYRFAPFALIGGIAALVAAVAAGARLMMEETEQGLRQLVETDPLTGVLNRRGLAQRFAAMIGVAQRGDALIGLLVFDLDHFKRVNDRYGHLAGDAALAHFGRICAANLREGDAFGRLGGEEFAACLPVARVEEAVAVAERIRLALRDAPLITPAGPIALRVSAGITVRRMEGAVLEGLIAEADNALYEAKSLGRDQTRTYAAGAWAGAVSDFGRPGRMETG